MSRCSKRTPATAGGIGAKKGANPKGSPFFIAGVAKLVDAADLKSAGALPRAGSNPVTGTKK